MPSLPGPKGRPLLLLSPVSRGFPVAGDRDGERVADRGGTDHTLAVHMERPRTSWCPCTNLVVGCHGHIIMWTLRSSSPVTPSLGATSTSDPLGDSFQDARSYPLRGHTMSMPSARSRIDCTLSPHQR